MMEEISNISAPRIKNKIHNIYNDRKRSQSPNLMISNLSQNKSVDYVEEDEYLNEILPKNEEKKHHDLNHKDDIDSYDLNTMNKKNNINNNYDNEHDNNFNNDESNIQDKNCQSEFDYRNENPKKREYDSTSYLNYF